MTDTVKAGAQTITVSNRGKVLFPDDGVTKGDLISYALAIAPKMLPYLKNRPLTMERYPDGIGKQRVFQKNAPEYFPSWISRAEVGKKDGIVTHPLANDAATLVYLANQAVLTHHIWNSTTRTPMNPDQIVFDLDPSTENFAEVRTVARGLRDLLDDIGLVPFVKTTGSRGLHVVTPIRPAWPYERVYGFAEAVVERLVREHPKLLTLEFLKAKRNDRIFFDINRNAYAQTAVAPFTVRAREGAPVALPIDWDEVGKRSLRSDGYGMRDALERPDAWSGFRGKARSVAKAARALGLAGA